MAEDASAMWEISTLENEILNDLEKQTGYSFRCVDGIGTRDPQIAESVLPALCRWVPLVNQPNMRHAIYARFHTPFAYPYLEKLIEWWQSETYDLALSSLTQSLALLAKPADGLRLWKLCQELPRRPFHYMLLAKLAAFPATEREVRDVLVKAMQEDASLTVGDLEFISKADDPRIRKWFEGQVDSPNRYIKVLARRVVAKGSRLPKQVEQSSIPPDRSQELFSTEVDLEDLKLLLDQVARDLHLKIPAPLRKAKFLSSLDLDRWVVTGIATASKEPVRLWFRMEDIDTVEIVVTKNASRQDVLQ